MSTSAISIQNLTKDFRVGMRGYKLRAVEDLSLEIADNEIFGLLGPNGCGKSTTMKVLLGLLEPTSGACSIFGVPSGEVRSRLDVGFLPEAPYFYRFLSGFELVCYGAKICGVPKAEIKERAHDVIQLVGLEEAAFRKVGSYSKGMLQRIGIAQAIVHDPRLIILDEPTAGVDPIGSAVIADLIFSLKERGKTVFLCSHLLAQMEGLCDRVGIMNRGRMVLEGAVDTLLARKDCQSFLVEGLSPEAEAEVKAVLDKHGASYLGRETPKVSLDQLFLECTEKEERGEK